MNLEDFDREIEREFKKGRSSRERRYLTSYFKLHTWQCRQGLIRMIQGQKPPGSR